MSEGIDAARLERIRHWMETFRRQAACAHEDNPRGARFCRWCGEGFLPGPGDRVVAEHSIFVHARTMQEAFDAAWRSTLSFPPAFADRTYTSVTPESSGIWRAVFTHYVRG
jgi:hypothetical protein